MVKVSIKEGGLPRLVTAPSTWGNRPPAPPVEISLHSDPNDGVHFLSSDKAIKFREACTDRGILSLVIVGDRGDQILGLTGKPEWNSSKNQLSHRSSQSKELKLKCRSQRSRARMSQVE